MPISVIDVGPPVPAIVRTQQGTFSSLKFDSELTMPTPQSKPLAAVGVASTSELKDSPQLNWIAKFSKDAASLRQLRAGWDGPDSKPIKGQLLYRAGRMLQDALMGTRNVYAPYVIPVSDGSIQIEWHTRDYRLELSISIDQALSFYLRDRRRGLEVEGEGDQAADYFMRWAGRVAASSDHDRNEGLEAYSPSVELAA